MTIRSPPTPSPSTSPAPRTRLLARHSHMPLPDPARPASPLHRGKGRLPTAAPASAQARLLANGPRAGRRAGSSRS
jgi:hypothetical protein